MEVWLWMSLVSWNDYHLKLEGTLEVSPCRWLPVCCPRSQLRGLATGRVLDFSSGRCQGRGDSQSLSQGRDSRHPGSSCMYHLCIDMQMMSEWMNEWMNEWKKLQWQGLFIPDPGSGLGVEIRESALAPLNVGRWVLAEGELYGGDGKVFFFFFKSWSNGDPILVHINRQSCQAVHIRFVHFYFMGLEAQ